MKSNWQQGGQKMKPGLKFARQIRFTDSITLWPGM